MRKNMKRIILLILSLLFCIIPVKAEDYISHEPGNWVLTDQRKITADEFLYIYLDAGSIKHIQGYPAVKIRQQVMDDYDIDWLVYDFTNKRVASLMVGTYMNDGTLMFEGKYTEDVTKWSWMPLKEGTLLSQIGQFVQKHSTDI